MLLYYHILSLLRDQNWQIMVSLTDELKVRTGTVVICKANIIQKRGFLKQFWILTIS